MVGELLLVTCEKQTGKKKALVLREPK